MDCKEEGELPWEVYRVDTATVERVRTSGSSSRRLARSIVVSLRVVGGNPTLRHSPDSSIHTRRHLG